MTDDTSPKCIIFDCDGTLVDSEEVTNEIIAEMAWELGITMTGDEATATFGGKTLDAVLYKMRELSGKEIPDDWLPRLIKRVSEAWKTELNPVNGVRELLENLNISICVASNGEPIHVNQSLEMTGLRGFFDGNIFCASDVGVPKPAPDLFLYAAKKMGFKPEQCIVIEDSISGVMAANRAKIKVYGLVKMCSAEELENAGAIPFTNMRNLPALLGI
jgi:HAD superfamily hydrolase (TIGR01509 family)